MKAIQLSDTTKLLKESIINSQYNALKLVNKEKLRLYYYIGAVLSFKIKEANWGDGVLQTISTHLQNDLPGLKGFSAQNLKKMRQFFDTYPTPNLLATEKSSPTVSLLKNNEISMGSPLVNQLGKHFWNIGFSLHYLILSKTNTQEEKRFYIEQASAYNWTKRILENHLTNKLFYNKDISDSNFESQITEYQKVQEQFRDEYLLDFVSIEEAEDERKVESRIVQNIRNFLLNLGTGFSFMGNQYRLEVDNEEYFIDLLFYNRQIKSLVAIELKKGKFNPRDAGQLNFYLNLLDNKVKLPDENPSIGIILCREKNETTVEYALQNINSPMGVAIYKTKEEIPEIYQKILPNTNDFLNLLNNEQ